MHLVFFNPASVFFLLRKPRFFFSCFDHFIILGKQKIPSSTFHVPTDPDGYSLVDQTSCSKCCASHLQGFSPYLSVWSLGSRCHIMIPWISWGTGSIGFLSFWNRIYSTSSVLQLMCFPPLAPEKNSTTFYRKRKKKQLGQLIVRVTDLNWLGGQFEFRWSEQRQALAAPLPSEWTEHHDRCGVSVGGRRRATGWVFSMFCWLFLMKNNCFIFVRNFEIISQILKFIALVVF